METVIAIGSNQGDRLHFIRSAIKSLASIQDFNVTEYSSVFESEAHVLPGQVSQHPYLNAVVLLETASSPVTVLEKCLVIEKKHGRHRTKSRRWEPRMLDLDVIVCGNLTVELESLSIPHPRLGERRFVLEPLFELRPEMHIPSPFDSTVQYLLANCRDTSSLVISVPQSVVFPPDESAR